MSTSNDANKKLETIQVVLPEENGNGKRKRMQVIPDEGGEQDLSHSSEVDNKFNKNKRGKAAIMSMEKKPSTDPTSAPVPGKQFQQGDDDDVMVKYRSFKSFDTIEDFSDHHYKSYAVIQSQRASQKWAKAIQRDWRLLENDLPDTIFARAYEGRMDLLRAVIVGAAGTPYHDGLFFFDIHFPPYYPDTPPLVNYHAHNLQINPNINYHGYICLSLLNTNSGSIEERWTPGLSTMLQVLLSLQALVLNEKPWLNEAGNEKYGEKVAQDYNESTFILSCRTMLYTLKNPPKYFEDYVLGHFRLRAYTILAACKAYIEGAQVGSVIKEVQDESQKDEGQKNGSSLHSNRLYFKNEHFKSQVGTMVGNLVPIFISKGAKNCEQFICMGDQTAEDESQAQFQHYSPSYYSLPYGSPEHVPSYRLYESPPYSPDQANFPPFAHHQAPFRPSAPLPIQAQLRPLAHPRAQFQHYAPKPAQDQYEPFSHSQARFQPYANYPAQAQSQPLAHSAPQDQFRPFTHPRAQFHLYAPKPAQDQYQAEFQPYANYPAQAQFQPLAHYPAQAQFQPSAHTQAHFLPLAHSQDQLRPSDHPRTQIQPSAHPQQQFQPLAHSQAPQAQFQPLGYPQIQFQTSAHLQPWANPQAQLQPLAHSQAPQAQFQPAHPRTNGQALVQPPVQVQAQAQVHYGTNYYHHY